MSSRRSSFGKFLMALMAVTMTGLSANPIISVAQAEKKHLVWDAVDKVWRCVGSPVDCDFEQT